MNRAAALWRRAWPAALLLVIVPWAWQIALLRSPTEAPWLAVGMGASCLAMLAGFRVLGRLHPANHGMTAPQTMLVLGMAGMLAGLLVDARGHGLDMLAALCRSGDALDLRTTLALHWTWLPAMHLGMFAGGLATMPVLRRTRQHCRRQLCARAVQNLACLAWMLAGMTASVLVLRPGTPSAMLGAMFAGMVWGMVAGVAVIRLYFQMAAHITRTAGMTGKQEGV